MKLKKLLVLSLTLALTASSLNGCSNQKDVEETGVKQEEDSKSSIESSAEMATRFPAVVVNNDAGIEGGVLQYALVADSAFAGVLNPVFKEDHYDNEIVSWFTEPIISYDENFKADQDGAATYEYDTKAKTVTLHMKEGVKWHDGEPVTLDDLVFAFELLCHKDYEGIYYGESESNIVGVEEYHKGKADKISGLELSNDKMTLTIHFKDFYPSILVGGFWVNPIPRHYYKGIAVKDMAAHEKTRKKPIGFGPFKVKNVVPGESVQLERFDDYWRGRPKLDGVVITVIKQELVPAAMKEGKFDLTSEFTTQQYTDNKNPTNYKYAGEVETTFGYTGFKLGKWDQEKTENIVDPNAKMANVKLRQAIGYAVDNATIGETMYNGLRFLATTVITPRHAIYQNTDLAGYTFDTEKAKKLLDEAGYVDVDGDGYREDPKGKQFTIIWAMMEGEGADTLAQFKIQCWKNVGLKVELYNGRLTEFNAFYEAVQRDDPGIDMYDAAWNTGYDPNPASLWGHYGTSNFTRYTSDTFDAIIKDISSEKAWDNSFMTQKYKEWQETFFKEACAIPSLWRMRLVAVNNRVKNYEITATDVKQTLHLIELTASETVK